MDASHGTASSCTMRLWARDVQESKLYTRPSQMKAAAVWMDAYDAMTTKAGRYVQAAVLGPSLLFASPGIR
jgi:hypothetical protein